MDQQMQIYLISLHY